MKDVRNISILFFLSVICFWVIACKQKENKDPQPPSGQFFKNRMCQEIVVSDCRQDTPIGKMIATAMQGIINQDSSLVYLFLGDHYVRQLDDTKRDYNVLAKEEGKENPGLQALFKNFCHQIERIYIWNPEQEWTWNIALMLSAHTKGIPVTHEIINELIGNSDWKGETIVLDNKWESKKDAYEWAIQELLPLSHTNIIFSIGLRNDWRQAPWTLYDYAVASKGFAFWLDDAMPEEQEIIKDICRQGNYQPGAIVMGYAKSGDDLLITVNEFGIGYVVSDYYANGSFWCSYPNKSFTQPKGEAKGVSAGKVYVSIVFSDGDNLQFDQNSLYNMWTEDPMRGEIPVGTTLAAGLQEINPFLMQWFYENKTDNDELVAGPSGYQFIYGRDYQEEGYETWLKYNRTWLASGGFHTACLWHTTYGTSRFDRYIETCGLQGIFDGDDKTGIAYKNGVIIMNQGEHIVKEGELYNALSKVALNDKEPVFVNVYPIAAEYGRGGGIARLKREIDRLENDFPGKYEYMLPKDLTASAAAYFERLKLD